MTDETAVTTVTDEERKSLRLVAFKDGIPLAFALPPGGTVTIGRSRECEVRIDDSSISRRHAAIHIDDEISIDDLGSANGTIVFGEPLSARGRIVLGTIFRIGNIRAIVSATCVRKEPTPMERTRALLQAVAAGTITVLVQGETGAGKEVLAREIHTRSPRVAFPFVPINCAALPQSLLESELFGHERGAFTGAGAARVGLFEAAAGGTIMLDEIGDMPLTTQAKILRVLENREVLPVGGVRPRPIDVRVIAATHRDVHTLVREGEFREDLLFRIAGATIVVPPLRERVDEIRGLAKLFLGSSKKSLSPGAIALVEAYRWPGNVRELKSTIERSILIAPADVIGVEHLAIDEESGDIVDDDDDLPTSPTERGRLQAALERAGGNQTEAAKRLGISRRTLGKRLNLYGIKRPRRK